MIDSFIERITNPTVVVRVGEQTVEGAKYIRSIFGEEIAQGHLLLKGYDRDCDWPLFQSVMRTLFKGNFRIVEFVRMGPPKRTIIVTLCERGVASMQTVYHRAPQHIAAE